MNVWVGALGTMVHSLCFRCLVVKLFYKINRKVPFSIVMRCCCCREINQKVPFSKAMCCCCCRFSSTPASAECWPTWLMENTALVIRYYLVCYCCCCFWGGWRGSLLGGGEGVVSMLWSFAEVCCMLEVLLAMSWGTKYHHIWYAFFFFLSFCSSW